MVGAFYKGFAKDSKHLFMSVGFFLWQMAAGMNWRVAESQTQQEKKPMAEYLVLIENL